MSETLRRMATRVRELADVLSASGLAEHALQADALADEMDRLALVGVPTYVDPDQTTPQTVDLEALERNPRIGIPDDDDD